MLRMVTSASVFQDFCSLWCYVAAAVFDWQSPCAKLLASSSSESAKSCSSPSSWRRSWSACGHAVSSVWSTYSRPQPSQSMEPICSHLSLITVKQVCWDCIISYSVLFGRMLWSSPSESSRLLLPVVCGITITEPTANSTRLSLVVWGWLSDIISAVSHSDHSFWQSFSSSKWWLRSSRNRLRIREPTKTNVSNMLSTVWDVAWPALRGLFSSLMRQHTYKSHWGERTSVWLHGTVSRLSSAMEWDIWLLLVLVNLWCSSAESLLLPVQQLPSIVWSLLFPQSKPTSLSLSTFSQYLFVLF